MPRRLSPTRAPMRARISAARSGLPAACSSITRSTIDLGEVTPLALMACRSAGDQVQPVRPGTRDLQIPDIAKDLPGCRRQPARWGRPVPAGLRMVRHLERGDIEEAAVAQDHHGRAGDAGAGAADEKPARATGTPAPRSFPPAQDDRVQRTGQVMAMRRVSGCRGGIGWRGLPSR